MCLDPITGVATALSQRASNFGRAAQIECTIALSSYALAMPMANFLSGTFNDFSPSPWAALAAGT
jgi:hypothetical protein